MNKGRLVVVSNRLPHLREDTDWKSGQNPSAGGLVSALLPVMESTKKGVWMGWSGKAAPKARPADAVSRVSLPLVDLLALDLSDKEVNAYYNGFCNRTLWPMFHCFQARVREDMEQSEVYFKVNEKFGRALVDFLEPEDMVWVHDYHMIPLARFLRREGFSGPMGFFLHIPFPPLEMIEILNDPLWFMEAWLDYDLVGFHCERYQENYFEVMERLMLGVRQGDWLYAGNRRQRVISCPIGISTGIYDPAREINNRTSRRKGLRAELPGGKLVLSVDRLDYTKGIPERLAAFERLFKTMPHYRRQVSLVQICSPSRTRVAEYREQKQLVDGLAGRINGENAEHDWSPIRYLYRTYGQADLARFYRDADVCLVTPLRDGMNLVAIEYVAAQRPEAPGALVLSRFTGVAEYLTEAVLVNPYLSESVVEGLDRALSMSLAERKERHQAMLQFVTSNTATLWAGQFLEALNEAYQSKRRNAQSPLPPGPG